MANLARIATFIIFVTLLLTSCAALQRKDVTGEAIANKVIIEHAGFHEDCVVLKKGQVLDYKFRASRPVNFNIHYHLQEGVEYPISHSETTESGEIFDPERAISNPSGEETFCLMWENKGSATASLSYEYEIRDGRQ